MHLAVCIRLVPGSRKQQHAIHTRIKGAALILGGAFDLDSFQMIVPRACCRAAQLIHRTLPNLVAQVQRRLLEPDEGGGDMCFQRQALPKAKDTDPVRTGLFHFKTIPWSFELQQVVGSEVVRHAARVCSRCKTNGLRRGIGFDRTLMAREYRREGRSFLRLRLRLSQTLRSVTALRSVGTSST